jgi:precorrin-2 dehydrogenase/sirohydrochlorin ferrochelatase
MDAFPAFFPLAGARIVLAGAGPGIEAKARLLESSPATLLRVEGHDAMLPGAYRGARLAFIAGEDEAFAQGCAAAARAAHVLVNVIDRPAWSDFNTPAVVDRGEVVAAVGTGGASPVLATLLRTELESRIPEGAGRFAALLRRMQEEVRTALPDIGERRNFLRQALSGPAATAALAGDIAGAEALLRLALNKTPQARGKVSFIDTSGPVDLLTLRAVRSLAAADAIAADEQAAKAFRDLARRDADHLPSEAVAGQAAAQALTGRAVARLTYGPANPAEIATLEQLGVTVEILNATQP